VKRKRVFATLKVLGTVLEQLSEEIPDEVVFMLSGTLNIINYHIHAFIYFFMDYIF